MKDKFKDLESRKDFSELSRLSIYIFDHQLKRIDEICKKRGKKRRIVFFEAIANYISLFDRGKV